MRGLGIWPATRLGFVQVESSLCHFSRLLHLPPDIMQSINLLFCFDCKKLLSFSQPTKFQDTFYTCRTLLSNHIRKRKIGLLLSTSSITWTLQIILWFWSLWVFVDHISKTGDHCKNISTTSNLANIGFFDDNSYITLWSREIKQLKSCFPFLHNSQSANNEQNGLFCLVSWNYANYELVLLCF